MLKPNNRRFHKKKKKKKKKKKVTFIYACIFDSTCTLIIKYLYRCN